MKKSETTACLIAGVLATSVLLTGCGGGSGGGMSGLGATGATGAAGAGGGTGATGGVTDLLGLLGSGGGVVLDSNLFGAEGIQVDALTPADLADLSAAGITGAEGLQVLRSNGQILGFQTPTGNVFGVPVPGTGALPITGNTTLPALPAGIPRVGILGL